MRSDENPPAGLIICAEKDEAVARYAHSLKGVIQQGAGRGVPDDAA
jgi:hypothetical protein